MKQARLTRIIDYIDLHLTADLSLKTLSKLACWSEFHCHRQFKSRFGVTLKQFILQRKFHKAACQLWYRKMSVSEVAFAAGYANAESFSRTFKTLFLQTPSEFAVAPNFEQWQALQTFRNQEFMMTQNYQVELVQTNAIQVAVMPHRGAPQLLPQTIGKFIAWRKQIAMPPTKYRTFNFIYHDPNEVNDQEFRFDLAVALENKQPLLADDMLLMTIPEGWCAKIRHIGTEHQLENAVRYLYETWLPSSGYQVNDFPMFWQRVSFFPEVAANEAVTDIFLPLKDTSNSVAKIN